MEFCRSDIEDGERRLDAKYAFQGRFAHEHVVFGFSGREDPSQQRKAYSDDSGLG